MRACRDIWRSVGSPAISKSTIKTSAGDLCYWCGFEITEPEAHPSSAICGTNFTDHDLACFPLSPVACRACAWMMSGRPPDTLRMWSLIWIDEWSRKPLQTPSAPDLGPEVWLGNKGDLSPVVDLLSAPPDGRWAASIADSGKVHTAPSACLNSGADPWVVRYERYDVSSSPTAFQDAVDVVRLAYSVGYSRAAVCDRDAVSPTTIKAMGITQYETVESELDGLRETPLLEMITTIVKK